MREHHRRDLEARFESRYKLSIHDPRILQIAAPASVELDRDAQAKLHAYAKVRNFLIDKEREFAELLKQPVPEHPSRRIGDLPHDLYESQALSRAFAAEDPLNRSAREAVREILSMFNDTFISAYGKLDQIERQIDPDELLRSRRDLSFGKCCYWTRAVIHQLSDGESVLWRDVRRVLEYHGHPPATDDKVRQAARRYATASNLPF